MRLWFFVVGVVEFAATGCLSAATVQVRRDVEMRLEQAASAIPPREIPPSSAVTGTSTCSDLAYVVAASHPRMQAAQARARAALARSRAESSIPPPRASLEVWDFPIGDPSRANREGMYMVGISQEFSPRRERDSLARAEAEAAQTALGELDDVGRELWAQVASACVDWSAAEAVHERLSSHRALLFEMREALLARYPTGGDSLGALARADAELAAAERHVAEAEEEIARTRATLVAFADGSISLPSSAPHLRSVGASTEVDELVDLAMASRGVIRAARARHRGASARLDAAGAEARIPTFEVQVTYMQMPSARAGIGAMVSMSLPWLWGPASAQREGAEHELDAAAADVEDVDRNIRVEITRSVGQLRTLTRSLSMLEQREIPAAQRALEAERASLAVGSLNLASWIQAAHGLREAHIDEARIRGTLERAWIELEASVGRPLSPQSIEPGAGP